MDIKENKTINNLDLNIMLKDYYNISILDYDNLIYQSFYTKFDLLTISDIKNILLEQNIKVDLSMRFIDNTTILVTVSYCYKSDKEVYYIERLIDNFKAKLKTFNIIIKLDVTLN